MGPTEKEPTLSIQLTTTDCQNFVAFGNRATMSGKEADTWVALKMKLLHQVQDAQTAAQEKPQDRAPDLHAVPESPGGTE